MALSVQEAERLLELQRLRREEGREFSNEEKAELESLLQLHRERASTEKERLKNLNDQLIQLNEQKELVEDLKKIGDSLIGIDELRLKNSIKLTEIQKEEEELAKKKATLTEEEYLNELKLIAAKRTKLGLEEAGQDAMGNLLKITTGMTEQSKLLGESLLNPMAGLTGAMDKLKTVNPAMIVGAFAMNSLQLAAAQDQATSSFNKATGATGKFDSTIIGLERALVTTGVSSQEAAESVKSLFLNVSDFTEMSETQQQTLGETVAVLNELGVASETTAKNIQFATKVLGQSTDEAAALQRELFVFAQDLGVSASQIAGDFQTLAPQIAAMGKNGVDAFKNLEAQSKSTGLAMNELLQIVQKFDRFDTAAESVSRLNALLGGPFLNATELVAETDLSKRFEILKDRLDDAGKSFDKMSYYERKATAAAMGLNEQQLALLMRGRIDLVQAPQKSAADIEALAEQTAQFNTLMDELSQIARTLAISFGPLVSYLKMFLDLISPIMEYIGPLIGLFAAYKTVVGAVTVAKAQYALVTKLATDADIARTAAAQGAAASQGVLNGVLGAGGKAMSSFAASASAAIPVLGTIAGVALSIAAAIGAIGLAIYMVVEGFKVVAGFMSNFIAGAAESLLAVGQGIATSIDKINELELDKALAYTATVTAYGVASTVPAAIANVAGGALDRVGIAAEAATPEPTATAPAVAGGPTPEIKLNIMIDGESLTGAINNVEVSNYVNGQSSKLYASIIDAIVGTQLVSS